MSLAEIRALVGPYAEKRIPEMLAARTVRWRHTFVDPADYPVDGFWQLGGVSIDWAQSIASAPIALHTSSGMAIGFVTVYGIQIAREDIEVLLPEGMRHQESFKELLVGLAQDHPHADGEQMMHYARRLKDLLEKHPKATPKMREADPRSIAARLYELELGPRQV